MYLTVNELECQVCESHVLVGTGCPQRRRLTVAQREVGTWPEKKQLTALGADCPQVSSVYT